MSRLQVVAPLGSPGRNPPWFPQLPIKFPKTKYPETNYPETTNAEAKVDEAKLAKAKFA